MTTGEVVSGEGEGKRDGERDGERGGGHRKMAAALSHILSAPSEDESVSLHRLY